MSDDEPDPVVYEVVAVPVLHPVLHPLLHPPQPRCERSRLNKLVRHELVPQELVPHELLHVLHDFTRHGFGSQHFTRWHRTFGQQEVAG